MTLKLDGLGQYLKCLLEYGIRRRDPFVDKKNAETIGSGEIEEHVTGMKSES